MSVNWVVAVTPGVERKPWVDPLFVVMGGVVVTEVVVVIARPKEETVSEHGQVDHNRRRVVETPLRVHTRMEVNRRKQKASTADCVIPVTINEDVATRSPDVIGRNPDPVQPHFRPVTRAPGVAAQLPYPTARYPTVFRRGCVDIGTYLNR
ncbi:MAG TPA: hypothetical protein VMW90_08190, partial [Acidobacteriota bacterium]|nr:hypothetical protein [Acidobacteriota bacterium]